MGQKYGHVLRMTESKSSTGVFLAGEWDSFGDKSGSGAGQERDGGGNTYQGLA